MSEHATDAENCTDDRRPLRTCVVCGRTDRSVKRNTFPNHDIPPLALHHGCLPPMTADYEQWYATEVDT